MVAVSRSCAELVLEALAIQISFGSLCRAVFLDAVWKGSGKKPEPEPLRSPPKRALNIILCTLVEVSTKIQKKLIAHNITFLKLFKFICIGYSFGKIDLSIV